MDVVATLITVTTEKNSNGFPVNSETPYEVYVRRKSVNRSEFYQSMQAGITATVIFSMCLPDYEEAIIVDADGMKHKPSKIDCDGDTFNIIRAYSKDDDTIELTCSDLGASQ